MYYRIAASALALTGLAVSLAQSPAAAQSSARPQQPGPSTAPASRQSQQQRYLPPVPGYRHHGNRSYRPTVIIDAGQYLSTPIVVEATPRPKQRAVERTRGVPPPDIFEVTQTEPHS